MSTKIVAARLATSAGVTTVITRSSNPGNIINIVKHIQASRSPPSLATKANQTPDASDTEQSSEALLRAHVASNSAKPSKIPLHTRFLPSPHPVRDRYFWILYGLRPHGTLYIDAGAHNALVRKAGLLPVGVVDVEGVFAQHEAVRICVVEKKRSSPGEDGKLWEGTCTEVGRALTNYSSAEIARIKGKQSSEIEKLLGYMDSEYVAPRESISFFSFSGVSRPATPVREIVVAATASGRQSPAVGTTPAKEVINPVEAAAGTITPAPVEEKTLE